MGQRIRYTPQKDRDNTVISVQAFISQKTGAKYRIVLDFNENVFKIRNERTKEFVVKSSPYKNNHVLKSKARERLTTLGVVLTRESRWRTFGLCEKGYTQKKHTEDEDGND